MSDWMTTEDLVLYLKISEKRIRSLIKRSGIPFSDRLGEIRFNKSEINEWMKTGGSMESEQLYEEEVEGQTFVYRGKRIRDYTLTASIVLIGETPLGRLPGFIKKAVEKTYGTNERKFLYREEFEPFEDNFNDYLRLSCQLGLIDNKNEGEKKKHYYLSECAKAICLESDIKVIKNNILDNILTIVRNNEEIMPNEKCAVLLLWYFLKLNENGITPTERHFKLEKDKPNNFFPRIRLNFVTGLWRFLFEGNTEKEREFMRKWDQLV